MQTKPDRLGRVAGELSVAQLNAVDLLVTGTGDREVAEAVGVTRQTVCGWRNHDPAFVAALNARRLEGARRGLRPAAGAAAEGPGGAGGRPDRQPGPEGGRAD